LHLPPIRGAWPFPGFPHDPCAVWPSQPSILQPEKPFFSIPLGFGSRPSSGYAPQFCWKPAIRHPSFPRRSIRESSFAPVCDALPQFDQGCGHPAVTPGRAVRDPLEQQLPNLPTERCQSCVHRWQWNIEPELWGVCGFSMAETGGGIFEDLPGNGINRGGSGRQCGPRSAAWGEMRLGQISGWH
jgi:hypothetical protein